MTETPEISVAGTRHSLPLTRFPDVRREPVVSPLTDTKASGGGAPTWMPSGTGSLVKPLPSCTASVAVRFGGGAGCGAGATEDFTDCQAAESDALSCPGGRCEDGMAMTRSVAMVAAIATAIEKRMTC